MIKAGHWCGLLAFGVLSLAACGDDSGDGDDLAPTSGSGGSVATAGSGGSTAGSSAAGMGGRSGSGGAGTGSGGSGGAAGGSGGSGGAGGAAGAAGAGSGGSGGAGGDDDAGMVDPCENLSNACEDEGKACDGTTLVTCAANSAGCLVETRTDCTAGANDVCDDDASPPVCKPDPCLSQGALKPNACVEEGTSCSGDFLVECEKDSAGCPIATRTDCTLDGNNTACSDDGDEAECVDDPCVGISNCTVEGTRCDGTTLVSCEERANGCLVEDRTDCTQRAGDTCDDSGTVARCDDCQNATGCTAVGTTCQGAVFRRCSYADDDDCLDLTVETCGESCNPTTGCVFNATCDGPAGDPAPNPLRDTLKAPGSYGDYDTEGAGNEFVNFNCRPGNANAENGPDLLFAVDVAAHNVATIELAGADFASGAPILFVLTDCSDAGSGNAEDSCTQYSTTSVTYFNDQNTTERVYIVVDSPAAANFGTFGLELDVHPVECGDGYVDDDEQCDDGNNLPGDGCNATCRVATGWACTRNNPSVCTRRPADGICGVLRCALPANAEQGSVLCCTTKDTCGLAFPAAYGNACIELEQAGTNDNDCADAPPSNNGSGWPQMEGCCQPDGDCGLRAGVGLGCVERQEVSLALEDGPGGLYNTPFRPQTCN